LRSFIVVFVDVFVLTTFFVVVFFVVDLDVTESGPMLSLPIFRGREDPLLLLLLLLLLAFDAWNRAAFSFALLKDKQTHQSLPMRKYSRFS